MVTPSLTKYFYFSMQNNKFTLLDNYLLD